jgi:hypothetical protein
MKNAGGRINLERLIDSKTNPPTSSLAKARSYQFHDVLEIDTGRRITLHIRAIIARALLFL